MRQRASDLSPSVRIRSFQPDEVPRRAPRLPLKHQFLLFLWFAYMVASPFYVFESGYPQPADFIMAILAMIALSGFVLAFPNYGALYLFGTIFLSVVAVVNLVWWSIYYQPIFIFSILFYIYNFTVLVCAASLAERFPNHVSRLIQISLLFSIIAEIIAVIYFPLPNYDRAIGTFNNPNQLGYWSLLAFAVWLVARRTRPLGMIDTVVALALGYVASASLSKAAMVGFLMMAVLAIIFQRFRRSWLIGWAFIAVVFVGAAAVVPTLTSDVQSQADAAVSEGLGAKVIKRLTNLAGEKDSTATGRGYDRMWLFPEYLLIGAGEGAYQRFAISIDEKEMHSTWGTILFSYGMLGMASFLALLFIVFRHALMRHLIYFLPIAAYGVTHQGARFSLLWVFFGLVYGLSRLRSAEHASLPRR